jgi:hypothetical protein
VHRLADNAIHAFELDRTGLRVDRLNIPLHPPMAAAGAHS